MLWNTESVRNALDQIPGCFISEETPREDRVTEGFILDVTGTSERLYVRGFVTEDTLPQGNDVEVEMVEVTTGYSDGDMPKDPPLIMAHAAVKVALVQLGHDPVDSMDPYF